MTRFYCANLCRPLVLTTNDNPGWVDPWDLIGHSPLSSDPGTGYLIKEAGGKASLGAY